VSEDSPQKGWDTWFGGEQDSSGGEQQAPERQVPPETPSEPPPESEAEQTSWTMPAFGSVPEGDAPQDAEPPRQEPEPAQPSQPRSSRRESRGIEAKPSQEPGQLAENQPTQVVQARPSAAPDTWQPQAAHKSEPTPEPTPTPTPFPVTNPWADAQPTAQVPQTPQSKSQSQPQQVQSSPDHEPTQVWNPTPAPQQPEQPPSSPDNQATQVWSPIPAPQRDAQPPQQAQPSQPPQNPYATAAMQQPAQPQQPPAQPTQQLLGYGAPPPQGPGAGYDQRAGWEPQPERGGPVPAGLAAQEAQEAREPQPPRPRSRRKIFVSSGIGAAAVVAIATLLVMNQGSLTGSSHPLASPPSGFQPTGSSLTGDAEQTASAFLSAWENGNFSQAAAYTDDPRAAQAELTAYETGLNLHGLQLTATGATAVTPAPSATGSGASAGTTASSSAAAEPPTSTAGVVTFNVAAKVGLPAPSTSSTSSAGASSSASASASASSSASSTSTSAASSSITASWAYSSKLTAYKKNGGWWVQWAPSLVAPNLTGSEKIVSQEIAPSAAEVEDASGSDLSSATDPGVHNIYLALKQTAPSGEGTPGVEIELESASGTPITSSADVLSQPVNTGVVKTTIDPTDEAAAQQAVLKYKNSSMVVLQPTTGDILAVANNDGENDFALTARIAPGSTNKIITSTALLTSGLVSSPSQAVVCPKTITVNGTVFNNSESESEPASTPFLDDFAISCNNAFGQWYSTIGATTLADTAEKYYGLNQQWDLGTGEAGPYYNIPSSSSNGELFQELFGQGQLEAAPLAMASVAATVDTGSFKQPIVVPGTTQLTATSLPSNVQQDLYSMMKAVVYQSNGTAYNVFSGVNSTVYGKTGTADVSTAQTNPNSWMVVFDPTLNVAIACVVLDAGYGASYAGPEAAATLESLQ
jgi:hypothetical protein